MEYMRLEKINENSQRKYDLIGWLYGEQNYKTNYHYFCYDEWLLKDVLKTAGFDEIISQFGPEQQNLCIRGTK